jgi:hypothetical protein
LADLELERRKLTGVRYLIVTDDGSGYKSSAELVRVPHRPDEATVLRVVGDLVVALRSVLTRLIEESPTRSLAIYLEANRIVSRPPEDDSQRAKLTVVAHAKLEDLVRLIESTEFREDVVHLVSG